MIAETKTAVSLRAWSLQDLPNLVKYANNPKIAGNLTNRFPSPYTKFDGNDFIEAAHHHHPTQLFAIDFHGEAVGSIGIFPQEDIHCLNAEIGYWIAEPHWGKGLGTEAIRLMVDYGFKTWPVTRIYARPFGHNHASHRVLEKAGFLLEGRFNQILLKNGDVLDELIYAIRKNKQTKPDRPF